MRAPHDTSTTDTQSLPRVQKSILRACPHTLVQTVFRDFVHRAHQHLNSRFELPSIFFVFVSSLSVILYCCLRAVSRLLASRKLVHPNVQNVISHSIWHSSIPRAQWPGFKNIDLFFDPRLVWI